MLVLALAGAGCRRPARALGALPYFPGAVEVGTATFEGEQFGFPAATWTQIELRSEAKYEDVRDFYKKAPAGSTAAAFENESDKRAGRIYTRVLSNRQRSEFYSISVEERTPSQDVRVLLRRGVVKR